MSTTLDDLLNRLWASPTLKRDALEAAGRLDPTQRKQLQDLVGLLAARLALRVQSTPGDPVSEAQIELPLSNERLAGLLELLTLAAFHSDTLLYLCPAEREERLAHWTERTGFDRGLVREAAVLGPAGINAFLKKAA